MPTNFLHCSAETFYLPRPLTHSLTPERDHEVKVIEVTPQRSVPAVYELFNCSYQDHTTQQEKFHCRCYLYQSDFAGEFGIIQSAPVFMTPQGSV